MLDYLFIAETKNGNIYRQNPEDVSIKRPDKSSFYDILDEPLKKFTLVGKGHTFAVDLEDGHIEIDGKYFYTQKPPEQSELRLIYFRRVQQTMKKELELQPDGTYKEIQTVKPITRYYIGWQTTVNGKNYKFELGVD